MNNYKKIQFCDECNKEQEFIYENVNRNYTVKGEIINVDLVISKCSICGEEIWDDDLMKINQNKIFSEYRKKKGIISPNEIKDIRDKYSISQKDLSILLGFGEKTLSRYENGSLPDETHNNILKMIKSEIAFLMLFNENKHKLNDKARSEIEFKLNYLMASKVFDEKVYLYCNDAWSSYNLNTKSAYDNSISNEYYRSLRYAI